MEGTSHMNGLIRRGVLAALVASVATMAFAGTASAGILTASAKDCGDESLSQPFSGFGDAHQYKLVQGGSFEGALTDWTLTGKAKVVSGNEPWKVGGSGHGKSLVIPAGSSAITAPTCVGLKEPTLRFFAKRNKAPLLGISTLAVSVYVKTSLGLVVPVPVGVVLGNGQWKATPQMLIVANLLPLLPDDRTPVAFQFTPLLGEWQIDDVYVDPMNRCVRARGGASACAELPAPRTLLLLLHHAGDEPQDLGRARRTDGAGLERLAPVADRPFAGQLVEVLAGDREADLGVGGDVAGDLRPGHLDAEQLDVAATAELELHDELELAERRNLLLEVRDGLLDEGLGVSGRHVSTCY